MYGFDCMKIVFLEFMKESTHLTPSLPLAMTFALQGLCTSGEVIAFIVHWCLLFFRDVYNADFMGIGWERTSHPKSLCRGPEHAKP